MIIQIYNSAATEAAFSDLHLSLSNGFVSSKINDKRDYSYFDIVDLRFWMAAFLMGLLLVFTFLSLFGAFDYIVIWLT